MVTRISYHHTEETKAKMRKPKRVKKTLNIPVNEVIRLYTVERLSARIVAGHFNVSNSTICLILHNNNILRRTRSEAQKGKIVSEKTGAKLSKILKEFYLTPEGKRAKAKISLAHTGKRHTGKAKAKMSEARKGERNHMYGKHLSKESKAKLREANKGKHHTEEAKSKIAKASRERWQSIEYQKRQSETRKALWQNPEYKKRASERQKGKRHTPEARAKMSRANKGKIVSEETRAKLSIANTGRHPTKEARANMSKTRKGKLNHFYGMCHTEESRAKMSEALKKRWQDPEYNERMSTIISETRMGERNHMYGKHLSKKHKAKLSETHKGLWQDSEYARKIILAQNRKPNKPEMALLALLKNITLEWEYVGDGQLIIAGKNPDFWNGDHKLAELYGDYWHQGENPQERIALFKQYGYDTLVIWESELKKPEAVLAKVAKFTAKNN